MKGVIPNLSNDDENHIESYKIRFYNYTDKKLAEVYFRELKIGITGVRRQMLYVIALKEVLREKFGGSPIEYDGMVLDI